MTFIDRSTRLELTRESSGLRHYLAGRPVHAGSFLRMKIDGEWVAVRYEWVFRSDQPAFAVLEDDSAVAIRDDHELCWPE
jgi:hypothetical protein